MPSLIALATSAALPQLDADEQAVLEPLKDLGIDYRIVVWNDPEVNWADYSAVIIRSTWDYTQHLEAFILWARHVDQVSRLFNPLPIVKWNVDKLYLQDLAEEGIPIVPTQWLHPEFLETVNLLALLSESAWPSVVIKPSVSAAGRSTYRIDANTPKDTLDAIQAELRQSGVSGATWMLQPFLHTIETHGEISVIFIKGEYSHAVRKFPAGGDFRIQEHFGGKTIPTEPLEMEMELARQVMATLPLDSLYARVDMVYGPDETLCLSELEAVEPSLYQRYAPASSVVFAQAIAEMCCATPV